VPGKKKKRVPGSERVILFRWPAEAQIRRPQRSAGEHEVVRRLNDLLASVVDEVERQKGEFAPLPIDQVEKKLGELLALHADEDATLGVLALVYRARVEIVCFGAAQ
jgi:hypothetical protein